MILKISFKKKNDSTYLNLSIERCPDELSLGGASPWSHD